jgi:hypothetical protein
MSTFHYGGTAIDPELVGIIDFDDTPEKLMMTSGETIYISAYRKRPSIDTASSSRTKLKRVPLLGLEAAASSGSASSRQAPVADQVPVRRRWKAGALEAKMPAARLRTPSRSPRRAAATVRAKEACAVVKPFDEGGEESQELEDAASKELEDHPEVSERAWGRQSLEEARASGLQSLQAATPPWRSEQSEP